MSEDGFRRWELETARDVGLFIIRSLVTLNGGAFVVLLTFIGNAESQVLFAIELPAIKFALAAFVIGLVGPLLMALFSYISLVPAEGIWVKAILADWIVLLNSGLCILSVSAFIVGVIKIVASVSALP